MTEKFGQSKIIDVSKLVHDEAGRAEVIALGCPIYLGYLSEGNVRTWKTGSSKIFF